MGKVHALTAVLGKILAVNQRYFLALPVAVMDDVLSDFRSIADLPYIAGSPRGGLEKMEALGFATNRNLTNALRIIQRDTRAV